MSYIGQGLPADTFQGFTTDKFTGDGTANKAFTLTKEPFSEDTILVTIDGVVQEPTDDFTVSGTTLTLVGTAANGSEVNVTHMGGPLPIGGASELDLNGASDKLILDADADTTISADTDDQIDFKAGGTDIMSLTATTATFNDGVEITVNDNSNTLKLTSTDADATNGPILRMFRDSSSPADSDETGRIIFSADNDAGEETNYFEMKSIIVDASDGTEDGQLRISGMVGGSTVEYMRFDPGSGGIVINDGSADLDFRVEGNGVANAFKIDGGNDTVGICNASSTDQQLIVENQASASGRTGFTITNPSSSAAMNGQEIKVVRSGSSAYSFLLCRSSSSGTADTEFNVRGDGEIFADGGTAMNTPADYAEMFEWKDGNTDSEVRFGYSVILDGDKIVKASDSDDASKIIGVVSAKPAVLGDAAWNKWSQKYLKDEWNNYIMEEYTSTEWVEVKDALNINHSYETDKIPSDVTVPSDAKVTTTESDGVTKLTRRKINPDYDSSKTYVPRQERKEWNAVGLMGKLRLRKGQPTGTNWIKMRDISDTVEEWLVR